MYSSKGLVVTVSTFFPSESGSCGLKKEKSREKNPSPPELVSVKIKGKRETTTTRKRKQVLCYTFFLFY